MAAFYATIDDIKSNISALSSSTMITSEQLIGFIERADSVINAKLARFYTVPVSDCPILNTIAIDLASYYVMTRRIYVNEKKSDSVWPDKYKECLRTLDEIYYGRMQLVSGDGSLIERVDNVGVIGSNTEELTPTFNELDDRRSKLDPLKDTE